MGSLFKSKKVKVVNDEAAALLNKQTAVTDKFTDNPAYNYQRDELNKIASGNYGGTMAAQTLKNEAARVGREQKYQFSAGAGAFNANPHLQQAMRQKQQDTTRENFALAMPGAIQNQADSSSQFVQNAHYNQGAGYSDATGKALDVYKYYFKPSTFSSILGAAAPFLNFIPGVGQALSAGASALSGATAGNMAGTQSGSDSGGRYTPTFGSQTFKQAQELNNQSNQEQEQSGNPFSGAKATAAPSLDQVAGTRQTSGSGLSENPFKKFKSSILGN